MILLSAIGLQAQDRPNVVFVLADDLGYGDVACFGAERCQIDTPGFDRLAREGMRFTDAHTVASVCIPARMAIMTGRYPWRFRSRGPNGPWGFLNPRLPKDEFTIGRMLGGAGYRTGYVGKWHLGTLMVTKDGENQGLRNVDYTKPLEIGPVQYGFDESFILPGSLDMYPYVFVRNNRWVGKVTRQRGWSAFHRVGPTAEGFEDYKVLDTFSSEAERFIAKHAGESSKKPFFLYLALTAPHTPTSPRPEFRGKSRLGIYGDFVMETDDCLVRVLDALDKYGIAKNTLVIATSDHGPALYAGRTARATANQLRELESDGHYSSGIYRGYKFSIYEGGGRVPLVARWPGVVTPGATCDRLIALQDLTRTLADIIGVELREGQAGDSTSYLPLLRNPDAPPTRTEMVFQSTHSFGVRAGAWKLALCPGSGCDGRFGTRPTASEAWQAAVTSFGKKATLADLRRAPFVQLFNLDRDPGETENLAGDHMERVDALWAVFEKARVPAPFRRVPRFALAE